jgi:hypothetical protein
MPETIKTDLVVMGKMDALEVFTTGGIKQILGRIRAEVEGFVPDLSTATSRKEIASLAHKISKAKVVLDNLGKNLVSDWKQKAKQVDAARKTARDFLDELRDEVRQPLTDWEEAEAARLAAEQLAEEIAEAAEAAYRENELVDRRREIERKEAELARQEEDLRAKELEAQQEREWAEREEQIRKEAETQAKREAERRIQDEKNRADRAERERIAAEERAKIEKEQAIQRAKEEAEAEASRKEEERNRLEAQEKAEAMRKAQDEAHQNGINNEVSEDLAACTVLTLDQAKGLIAMIKNGKIRHVSIAY